MDSLTQIVLGAACGEAVAGRKMGNRAMLWGAIGGTIPDLDVMANFFLNELEATAFHRGFMHSLLFSALAPWALAWLAQRFYLHKPPTVTYATWVQVFFWSIFTHPILDCFTNWGTQIWQPFSDRREQWNTISVVDPIYTVPFALCLLIAARLPRTGRARTVWTWLGIVWSCGYLAFTVWHKRQFESVFAQSLQQQGLSWQRMLSGPSIFNNVVWYGVAETDSAYYFGLYGFRDRQSVVDPITVIPKNHALLRETVSDGDRVRYFLPWFTNGYYNVMPRGTDTLQVNDLRFGLLGNALHGNNYVFPFLVYRDGHNQWAIHQSNRDRSPAEMQAAMQELWTRVAQGR